MTSPEFVDQDQAEPKVSPGGKKIAADFAAVRERGRLNASFESLERAFKAANPGMAVRWERYHPGEDGGLDDITFREAQGWIIADASQLGNRTESTAKSGRIRRGDLIMMYGPKELEQGILADDAQLAKEDFLAPTKAFNDALAAKRVRLSTGDEDQARGVGSIKVQEQLVVPRADTGDSEGGS